MSSVIDLRRFRKPVLIAVICALTIYLAWLAFSFLYPLRHIGLISRRAEEFGVDPALVCAMIHAESRFNDRAVSGKGASGLMQIVRQTADWAAREIGIEDYGYDRILEPDINIEIGCWYMARLIGQYGNEETALAAYNAGSGNVSGWLKDKGCSADGVTLDVIPFGETRRYIERVAQARKVYRVLLKVYRQP